ncbi:MAG: HAD-IIA family hydrolase [Frankiaceae bacterium]
MRHDVALLDLDGVLYLGKEAIPNVAPALRAARSDGMRLAFVTNNAMRTPIEVAEHLAALGVPASPDEVVTSSQAAAAILSERLPAGAAVMVVGGRGLQQAVRGAGFSDVTSADDDPAAVVQGLDPDITYQRLAEAVLAVRRGVLWVATNRDLTLPTPRGLLPGNGALVALVAAATGRTPEVAGKPERALHAESIRRSHATRPLVVGDRLDTDIEAAVRWQTPSMLVLTGVTSPLDLLSAAQHRRPDYLADDLRGLIRTHPEVASVGTGWRCGGWIARVQHGWLHFSHAAAGDPFGARDGGADDADGPDGLNALRAACMAVWHAPEGTPLAGIDNPPAPSRLPAGAVPGPVPP